MKRVFDKNDKLLNIGDVVRFYDNGIQKVGKISHIRRQYEKYQTYDNLYIGALKDYQFGFWESSFMVEKLTDAEAMLIMLENV
jgi:hypothetical protein